MFIKDITELEKNSIDILKKLNVDHRAYNILSGKMKTYLFYISDLNVYGANILKQDALSIGADFAVPKHAITCSEKRIDGILIVTQRELEILAKKETFQPFGLKEVAKELKKYSKTYKYKDIDPKIMGVLNINNDSFFKNSRVNPNNILKAVYKMIEDGADILDIGAVSSRPNSKPISEDEEFSRIKEIIEILYQNKIYEKIKLSLDSYSPKVIDFALNHGFKIINDITGLRHDEVARIVGKYDAEIVIMHMQGTPETMQNNPEYQDVIKEIYYYFSSMIEKAKKFGIDENKIILDPGIGFGKTLKHNIEILQSLRTFEILGFPILIGASRKSLINQIYPTPVEERLAGTLVLHQKALDNGAKILRVHDVKEHKQMIKTWKRFHQIETDLVNHND